MDSNIPDFDTTSNTNAESTTNDNVLNSYAAAAAGKGSELTHKQIDIHKRTFICRKLPPLTQTTDILTAIINQFNLTKPNTIIQAITQDINNKRRFYITFQTHEHKKQIMKHGLKIGNTTIPPQYGDITGFIPNVPFDITHEDILQQLSTYGYNIKGNFKTHLGVRVGGFTFNMDIKPTHTFPKQIQLNNHSVTIINLDQDKHCQYCYKYGHTQQHCRTKTKHNQQEISHDNSSEQQEPTENNNKPYTPQVEQTEELSQPTQITNTNVDVPTNVDIIPDGSGLKVDLKCAPDVLSTDHVNPSQEPTRTEPTSQTTNDDNDSSSTSDISLTIDDITHDTSVGLDPKVDLKCAPEDHIAHQSHQPSPLQPQTYTAPEYNSNSLRAMNTPVGHIFPPIQNIDAEILETLDTDTQFNYDMIVRLNKVIMALNDHNPDNYINTFFDNSNHQPYSPCKTISPALQKSYTKPDGESIFPPIQSLDKDILDRLTNIEQHKYWLTSHHNQMLHELNRVTPHPPDALHLSTTKHEYLTNTYPKTSRSPPDLQQPMRKKMKNGDEEKISPPSSPPPSA